MFSIAIRTFLVIFAVTVFFAIATAPVLFGIIFLTASAIGGVLVYSLAGAVIAGSLKWLKDRKKKGE